MPGLVHQKSFLAFLAVTAIITDPASSGEIGRYADRGEIRLGIAAYDTGPLTKHQYGGSSRAWLQGCTRF